MNFFKSMFGTRNEAGTGFNGIPAPDKILTVEAANEAGKLMNTLTGALGVRIATKHNLSGFGMRKKHYKDGKYNIDGKCVYGLELENRLYMAVGFPEESVTKKFRKYAEKTFGDQMHTNANRHVIVAPISDAVKRHQMETDDYISTDDQNEFSRKIQEYLFPGGEDSKSGKDAKKFLDQMRSWTESLISSTQPLKRPNMMTNLSNNVQIEDHDVQEPELDNDEKAPETRTLPRYLSNVSNTVVGAIEIEEDFKTGDANLPDSDEAPKLARPLSQAFEMSMPNEDYDVAGVGALTEPEPASSEESLNDTATIAGPQPNFPNIGGDEEPTMTKPRRLLERLAAATFRI